ncbi:MAG: hypothetical protein QOF13_112 [Solirubrobacterales bacterium]|jgi:hypothetical protein|nr:hypothetical protein [Solirubrobacterales bacterium]
MRHPGKDIHTKRTAARAFSARLGALIAALTALGLLGAGSASAATFETVDHFGGVLTKPSEPGKFPEEVQLDGVSDVAVNVTGVGGVAPGTIYAIGTNPEEKRIARFAPDGSFEEVWDQNGKRCGPATADPADPSVYVHCQAIVNHSSGALGVDVDQATGNVYVLIEHVVQSTLVPGLRIYNPDGTKLIAEFGEADTGGTVAESPGKLHGSTKGGIAVNDAGEIYVYDADKTFYHRVMVFRPETPGDYEHYVYAGQGSDIAAGTNPTVLAASQPVLDYAGNVYGGSEFYVVKYDPAQPSTPICTLNLPGGGITTYTVNPVTEEVFYYSYKNRQIHQMTCNGQGEFVETSAFGMVPQRGFPEAMTMDPLRKYDPGRPAGVLYAATPFDFPSTGSGGEPGAGPLGYVLAPAEENPPEVVSESVSSVTTTTATLQAQINPKGSPTDYVFQYITEAAYEANDPADRFAGASEAPLGGAALGSGQAAISAAIAVSGLAPDTAYRYRAVATSNCAPGEPGKVCEGAGAAQVLHTFAAEAPGLADDRAWELVSPVQKNGGEVFPLSPGFASCGPECKPGVVADRFPQQSSPDGEAVVYEGFPFSFGDHALIFNQYISRRTPAGWQTTTLSPQLQARGNPQGYKAFDAGLTKGLLYQVTTQLTPDAPSGYANLYAQPTATPSNLSALLGAAPPNRPEGQSYVLTYAGASADLSRVFFEANDALTEETPFAPEAIDGGVTKNNLYEWSAEGLRLVNVAPGNATTAPGAAFGTRETPPYVRAALHNAISADGSRAFWSDEAGQTYVRENAETTTAIPAPGKFLGASPDGSKVLLSSGSLYDLETETTTDLTEGKGGFEGLAGQDEDLAKIYFVDTEVLDETANEHGDVAVKGKHNLYSRQGGASTFIATLLDEDGPAGGGRGVWAQSPVTRTAEASPDGRWLTFTSRGKPTGYDNVGVCEYSPVELKYVPSAPCPEAYLYDSAADKLICASCNPSGEAPLGLTRLPMIEGVAGSLSQPRYLTDSGRLYFDSGDSLSAFDTNNSVEDVYQYEPEGVGTCKREGGCVSLISAGHEAVDSNLFDIDATGKNVFFTSRDQLVLKDHDDLLDLYVAREGGGIASETETGRGECQGEACQPLFTPPNDPTPGSSTFEGAGNVDEKKAAKKHKKRHAKKKHKSRQGKRAAKHNRGGAK